LRQNNLLHHFLPNGKCIAFAKRFLYTIKTTIMGTLPSYLAIGFGATTLLAVALFYKATKGSKATLLILMGWLLLQFLIARSGFYTDTSGVPPRFVLLVLPPLVGIVLLFSTPAGRRYIDSLDLPWLTLLHVVRIPVEMVLLGLFVHKAVPQLMTFEGRNFDIVSGLTAPVLFYFAFVKKNLGWKVLLFWNFLCLALLANIVITAVLSLPSPFQKLAFDQPNIAVLYFPFVWLPAFVVPLVLFSHLASIRQLLVNKNIASMNKTAQETTPLSPLAL
jgi:hypothetical protein